MSSEAIDHIIHTSVYDGLVNAGYASARTIRKAIEAEKRARRPRTALITGLERELRRRAKAAGADS